MGERICGTDFNIKGLMNTYDERRGQRGTYQEIWVQLQYALGKDGRGERTSCDGNLDARCTDANHPVQSPWPYLHFMASEIVSIQAVCNTYDVNNANTCMPQPVGAGKPNDAFYGGKIANHTQTITVHTIIQFSDAAQSECTLTEN